MGDARDPNARIDTHEAVCAERYALIHDTLNNIKSDVKGLYGRFWAIAVSTIGLLVSILVSMIFMYLKVSG